MIFMYGRVNCIGRLAKEMYEEAFPDKAQPNHQTFSALFRRFAEMGTLKVNTVDRGRPRIRRTPHLEEHILENFYHDPSGNNRHAVGTLPVSHTTV
ncbi:hypothetical protein PR048_004518 [Dryococelus australis]|uniref:DUF4817 domain-containing protein n=1 Tax=Dryococelus australis TaxID=614101 RepID=A0ABQ9I7K6_9NEOP|nr:hypothetical protein PR048_004518 [Dryococelus australis]